MKKLISIWKYNNWVWNFRLFWRFLFFYWDWRRVEKYPKKEKHWPLWWKRVMMRHSFYMCLKLMGKTIKFGKFKYTFW